MIVSLLDHDGDLTQSHCQILKIPSKRITQGSFERFYFCRHSSPSALLTRNRIGTLDLVLQLNRAVDQSLCRRRATWHIHIHWHNTVATTHNRIRIVIITPTIGTGTHRSEERRVGKE